jgi:hypothetical protein
MSTPLATPMNFMGNVLENFNQDPHAAQNIELAPGVAMDVLRNAPADTFANIPHFEFEAGNSDTANPSGPGSPATT